MNQSLPTDFDLQAFIDSLPVLIAATDSVGGLRLWNRACETLTGYTAAEVVSHPRWLDILSADPVSRAVFQAERSANPWELAIRTKDGRTRYVSWVPSAGLPTAGDTCWWVGTDITPQKQAESTLREQGSWLRSIFENMPVMIIAFDQRGQLVMWNQEAERITGYGAEEVLQDAHWAQRFFPDVTDWQTGDNARNIEIQLTTKTGEERFILLSAITDRLPSLGWTNWAIGIDNTDHRHTQDTQQFLAEASKQLSTSLDFDTTLGHLCQLVVPRLADWCVIDIAENDGHFHRRAGCHADPSKASLMRELQERYPVIESTTRHTILQVLRANQSWIDPEITEERFVREARDADHLRILRALGFRSEIVVSLDARGQILGTLTLVSAGRCFAQKDLFLVEELARRAALSLENARLYREAQEALQIRDQFLSIAAHELKTPITSLRGASQVLQRRLSKEATPNERDRRAVDMIESQSQRLSKLTDNLLDAARIQLGRFSLDQKPFDLCGLVQRLVEEAQHTVDTHPIQLTIDQSPLIIDGDELRLEQVFQNLLQNAVKYSPAGSPITVRVTAQAGRALVAVSDQGIGIPEASQRYLFQRFYRAPNFDSTHISGMGIGLFVVREIVSLHHGNVSVQSEEGHGSTFTIALPLADSTG